MLHQGTSSSPARAIDLPEAFPRLANLPFCSLYTSLSMAAPRNYKAGPAG
jgi:hypothetical protein